MKKIKPKIHILFLIFIIIMGAFLRIISFKTQQVPKLSIDDSSRDLFTVAHFVKFKEYPNQEPYCAGCPKFLKNSINYYYFLSFFYRIFSSLSGIYFLFLLNGIVLIPLIYFTTKNLFDTPTALIAAFLVAVSPKLIRYSDYPLQPFLIPTFSSIVILLLLLDLKKNKKYYSVLAGYILFLSLQIHLSMLVLIPFYFFTLFKQRKNINDFLIRIILILPAILLFLINNISFGAYYLSRNIILDFNPIKIIEQTIVNISDNFKWLINDKYLILLPAVLILAITKLKKQIKPVFPILLSIPIIGLFKNSSSNYYDSPFLPVIIIIFASSLNFLRQKKEMFFGFIFLSICYINITNVIKNYKYRNHNSQEIKIIAEKIDNFYDKSQPNLVWKLSDYGNYLFFQYYLEKENKKPLIMVNTNFKNTTNKFLVCSSDNYDYQFNDERCKKFIENNLKTKYQLILDNPIFYPNYVVYKLL